MALERTDAPLFPWLDVEPSVTLCCGVWPRSTGGWLRVGKWEVDGPRREAFCRGCNGSRPVRRSDKTREVLGIGDTPPAEFEDAYAARQADHALVGNQ